MTPAPIRFLSAADVLAMRAFAIRDQGGDAGIRDRAPLDAALAMPAQQFGGQYLHPDVPSMAAAYAFHICRNHPFIDGNKRAALAALIRFLIENDWAFDAPLEDTELTMVALAAGTLSKEQLTDWARRSCHAKRPLELRQFFRSIDPERLDQVLQSIALGSGDVELTATTTEASAVMPLLDPLTRRAAAALADGKRDTGHLYYGHALMLIGLYRIAEDMGYEW
jgi:death-on-curing protein